MEPDTLSYLSVCPAALEDSSRVAILCGQIGYPLDNGTVEDRLCRIAQDAARQVFVAKTTGDLVIGWVEVVLRPLMCWIPPQRSAAWLSMRPIAGAAPAVS